MPARLKPEWLAQLRAIDPGADLRFNEVVGRWEFILTSGDMVPRSQFWGWFRNPLTGQPIPPDPVTGLHPFRDFDDAAMDEACANLEKTFIGNPYDGAGTTRNEVLRRLAQNRHAKEQYRAQMVEELDARVRDRHRRIVGNPQVSVLADLVDEHGQPLRRERVA